MARLAAGHLRLSLSLRRVSGVDSPEWLSACDRAAARIGLRRAIRLRRSAEIDVPLTCGVLASDLTRELHHCVNL